MLHSTIVVETSPKEFECKTIDNDVTITYLIQRELDRKSAY